MNKALTKALLATGIVILTALPKSASSAVVIFRQPTLKLSAPNPQATPVKRYDHGDPTNDEQYLLEITNRSRANPADDLKRILASTDSHIQQAFEGFEVNIYQLSSEFAAYTPKPPLAFNPELIQAARDHSTDMARNDFQGHVGSNGSTLAQRLLNAGYTYICGGENVFAYAYSPWHAHAAFLVDWGVPDLGHRVNLLDLGRNTNFREIGIGIIPETYTGTTVGPQVITQDFGLQNSQVVFVTGVIYNDYNNNKFYDPGEGIPDVQIMPDHGDYYAVSSLSGGFAVPVAVQSGEYILSVTGPGIAAMTASVLVNNENVKLDFKLGVSKVASVTGEIVTGQPAQAMSKVKVTLTPGGYQAQTNNQGVFTFPEVPPGSYSLAAQLEGYTFQPNNFNFSLASGQTFRTQITGTLKDGENPPPSSGDTDDDPVKPGFGCAPPALSLMMVLSLGFWSLTHTRRT